MERLSSRLKNKVQNSKVMLIRVSLKKAASIKLVSIAKPKVSGYEAPPTVLLLKAAFWCRKGSLALSKKTINKSSLRG